MQDFPSFFDFSWTRNENQEGLESLFVFFLLNIMYLLNCHPLKTFIYLVYVFNQNTVMQMR